MACLSLIGCPVGLLLWCVRVVVVLVGLLGSFFVLRLVGFWLLVRPGLGILLFYTVFARPSCLLFFLVVPIWFSLV